jgi:D-arabinose 1-dehydrogenase-like Zn-dependent alcohol dehydrogenase
MKAVVVEDANRVCVREVPDPPKPGPYQALTRNVCASICNATDLKIAHRKLYFVTDYPTILGHEGVGRVIEVGRNARSFRVGDLVSRPQAAHRPQEGSPSTAYRMRARSNRLCAAGRTSARRSPTKARPRKRSSTSLDAGSSRRANS